VSLSFQLIKALKAQVQLRCNW